MKIKAISEQDIGEVRSLLTEAGWDPHSADLQHLDKLVLRSQVALVALSDEHRVVGFIRALTDGMSNGYISMLAVRKSHRRQGIGADLVRACMGSQRDMTWVLRAGDPSLAEFYQKLGFVRSSAAMERPRKPKDSG
ncbi:MAG: GNAT family N-acetyltransferase [Rhodocyclaceae bacterium]|nr:GNAT family N-acetyltransferase [Rhodocyclaceae bacterium]